ncbi:dimethylaniline monooxygenase [N-oxide-forming] 3-like [Contarinia nasturtii]|uniref:dimethylaniline monooxygenase [N-oxide-forming] 3-like n=1 Tax=Contarinia nasturtii TaxID=265458 RepID=UPI0012D42C1B|nr:dimethylaniline monooxygenase [N-oxide-forming] 3-like [Contarinia nasturtii]
MMIAVRPIKWILLVFIFGLLSVTAAAKPKKLNIVVIGAGASGLASAKNAIDEGHNVTVYEQGETLGGIWFYTDATGKDQYGKDIYTPMYQGLRTNVPFHPMEFPDFPFPPDTPSYPTQQMIFEYLQSYARHFNVLDRIKFHHRVQKVELLPSPGLKADKWQVTARNYPDGKDEVGKFDSVFVCSSVYNSPRYPKIEGIDLFQGKKMHSHDYRNPEPFKGKSCLIIGGGSSGSDIVIFISKTAARVTFSQNPRTNESDELRKTRESVYGPRVTHKGNVERITTDGAIFKDKSQQTFDVIIFATGYGYEYPFLGSDSGIKVEDNYVSPLYKQVLNIEHPTMAFIGVPVDAAHNQMYDLQARFALKFISGKKKMPTKKAMEKDLEKQMKELQKKGVPKHKTHHLGLEYKNYFDDLASTAGIANVPKVYADILKDGLVQKSEDPAEFRSNVYAVDKKRNKFSRQKVKSKL